MLNIILLRALELWVRCRFGFIPNARPARRGLAADGHGVAGGGSAHDDSTLELCRMAYADKLPPPSSCCQHCRDFSGGFANSLGAEDMVLTDLIAKLGLGIEIFSLDTGRLPAETYPAATSGRALPQPPGDGVLPADRRHRAIRARTRHQRLLPVGGAAQGVLRGAQDRAAQARAGRPPGLDLGLRRQQSLTRVDLADREFDADNGLWKFNPLIEWTEAEVWEYLRAHDVPYNALHDQHYPPSAARPVPGRFPWRRRPRRPLVVGKPRFQGVWPASESLAAAPPRQLSARQPNSVQRA